MADDDDEFGYEEDKVSPRGEWGGTTRAGHVAPGWSVDGATGESGPRPTVGEQNGGRAPSPVPR